MSDVVLLALAGVCITEMLLLAFVIRHFSRQLEYLKRLIVSPEQKVGENKPTIVEIDGKKYEVGEKNDIMNSARDEIDLTEDTPVDLNGKYNIEFRVDDELVSSLTGKN